MSRTQQLPPKMNAEIYARAVSGIWGYKIGYGCWTARQGTTEINVFGPASGHIRKLTQTEAAKWDNETRKAAEEYAEYCNRKGGA